MVYADPESNGEKANTGDSVTDAGYIQKKLFPEYVSLYSIELNSGKYEILRIAENTNARHITEKMPQPFASYDEYAEKYADSFILEEDREEFLDWHNCHKMRKRLCDTDKITYYYHSVSKEGKDSYYEAYAVKGNVDDKDFHIFLGYRNIDSILYKERETQELLKKALDQARLSNEIISAIARTYQYVSRIDIQMKEFHWCDFEWDDRIFPDVKGMLKRYKEKGLKICVWINPYIAQGTAFFREGVEKGYQRSLEEAVIVSRIPDFLLTIKK